MVLVPAVAIVAVGEGTVARAGEEEAAVVPDAPSAIPASPTQHASRERTHCVQIREETEELQLLPIQSAESSWNSTNTAFPSTAEVCSKVCSMAKEPYYGRRTSASKNNRGKQELPPQVLVLGGEALHVLRPVALLIALIAV